MSQYKRSKICLDCYTAVVETKFCNTCKTEKLVSEFGLRKLKKGIGLQHLCKDCKKVKSKEYKANNKDKVRESAKRYRVENKEAISEYYRNLRLTNPELLNERSKEYRRNNPEKCKAYTKYYNETFPEKRKETRRRYSSIHKEETLARSAKRKAAKRKAVPKFIDIDKVNFFYKEASRLTIETSINYEVDHIVPITSKFVCGLHYHLNLQVITESENASKGNRYWPDMPDRLDLDEIIADLAKLGIQWDIKK
jgi:hypothetical protein